MPRKYALVVVKGEKETPINESSNIASQQIREAEWDLMKGRITKGALEVAQYSFLATDPLRFMRGKII